MLLNAPSALQIWSVPPDRSPQWLPKPTDRARSDYSRVDGRRGPLLGTVIRRESPMDPFTAERHIVLALCCIAMALFVVAGALRFKHRDGLVTAVDADQRTPVCELVR